MKRIPLFLLVAILAIPFSAADEIDSYTSIYQLASNNEEQFRILQMMVDQKVSGAGDFYVAALRRMIAEFPNIAGESELNVAEAQGLLLAEVLGDEKKTAAANDLWQLTTLFKRDPLILSTVMIALGKMQEPVHFSSVLDTLQHTNSDSGGLDKYYDETVARAAIIALEYYGDTRAYIPVYFASVGWYSNWVKNQAASTMQKLADDPSPFMEQIIKEETYSREIKLAALQSIDSSGLPDGKKAELAAIALEETWKMPTLDKSEQTTLNLSRKLALTMFGKYGVPDNSAYALIERCYNAAADNVDRQDVIVTLIKLASDDSVRIIGDHLMDMNSKRRFGNVSTEDLNLTRFLITALGDMKNRNAIPVLNATAAMDWTDVIKNLAQAARKQIEQ